MCMSPWILQLLTFGEFSLKYEIIKALQVWICPKMCEHVY